MSRLPKNLRLDHHAFNTAMGAAVKMAQAGLYYEMGGCWALAHALYTRLKTLGYAPELVYRPSGFVHAWVTLDGANLDYRGVFHAAPGAVALRDLAALETVASKLGGVRGPAFEQDIAAAQRLLDAVFFESNLAMSNEPLTC